MDVEWSRETCAIDDRPLQKPTPEDGGERGHVEVSQRKMSGKEAAWTLERTGCDGIPLPAGGGGAGGTPAGSVTGAHALPDVRRASSRRSVAARHDQVIDRHLPGFCMCGEPEPLGQQCARHGPRDVDGAATTDSRVDVESRGPDRGRDAFEL